MKSPRFALAPALGLVLLGAFSCPNLKAGDSPLEKAMKNMEDTKKQLYPAMKSPVPADKDKYIALAKTLKTDGEKSMDLIPEMAEKLPAAEKDAMVAAYRKDMVEFIKTTDSLIEALEKEQWEPAQAAIATMKTQEKAGHKEYRPKKDHGGGPKPGFGGPGATGDATGPAPAANPAPTAPAPVTN